MKRKLLAAGVMFATALTGRAVDDFYENDVPVNCPPQIVPTVNATNFVNNHTFNINYTNSVFQLYKTDNTLNYTNFGLISGNNGFQFDYKPTGQPRRASSQFVNFGTIRAGAANGAFFPTGNGRPQIVISATNVVMNSASNLVGLNGLFSASGRYVNLYWSTVAFEGLGGTSTNGGISDGYWGINATNATTTILPAAQFGGTTPTTGPHVVTAPGNVVNFETLTLPGAISYVGEATRNVTNRFVQVAFVQSANAAFTNRVSLDLTNLANGNGTIRVELAVPYSNPSSGLPATNFLYINDTFNRNGNLNLVPNGQQAGQTTFRPNNFGLSVSAGLPFTGIVPASPAGVFDFATVTNDFAAYQAVLSPATVLPTDLVQPIWSNMPGRVEIAASGFLDLTRTRLSGANYLRLVATNHFGGASGASLGAAYGDYYLSSTNGLLNFSNVVSAFLPQMSGVVNLWSGRWTNDADRAGVPTRSIYQVLFVDNQLNPTSLAQVQDVILRSTNRLGGPDSIMISDVLNIQRTLLLESQRVTITTNVGSVTGSRGEINIQSGSVTWPGATPRLQYLTNNGAISSLSSVFFGGSRTSAYYTSNFNEPYIAFVNRGPVSTEGSLIWADYFENSGSFNSGTGFGSVDLQSQIARLTNGSFASAQGDVSIATGELVVTNHALTAGRTLTLSATDWLTDTGVSNANTWAAGRGFQLLAQPGNGDLLGTTIMDTLTGGEALHYWAGEDRGVSVAGFANNAALGRVSFDGNPDSSFRFAPLPGTTNALYVDCLTLLDYTTTTVINGSGDVAGVQIDPNMTIYYAQALASDGTVAERINGANSGRFRWVAAYAGHYSSTNVVYPDGTTNRFNAALVQSENIDSDGDGTVNRYDLTPIMRSQDLALTVALASAPSKGALLTWQSVPGSTNQVFFRGTLGGAWQPLTNFVNPNPLQSPVSVFDPLAANSTRYYRVQMELPQP